MPVWVVAAHINIFVAIIAFISLAPFPVYLWGIRTPLVSFLGGPALIALPIIAYGDYFLGGDDGASFAFVTIPLMNVAVVAAVVVADRIVLRHQWRRAQDEDGPHNIS